MCLPRFSTRRRPERQSRGNELARVAAMLGTPLMPWQRHVADVGLELTDEGVPAYREVIVTIPRQEGKTTLVLAWQCHRALLWGRPQRVAYTAQTGWDARKKLIEDQAPMLMASGLAPTVARVLRGVGNEAVIFKSGSRIDVLASSASAGHGRTLDLGVIDEAFSDADDRREQAILPAMATRADGQLLLTSTMGTDESLYLNRKVDAGRDAVAEDRDSGIAYFEWSAPAELPIDDPATWRTCMPALGYTITEPVVAHALQAMGEDEFRRAFLNQRTGAEERVISQVAWQAVQGRTQPDGVLSFAMDCNPERSAAAVMVCDTLARAEMIDYRMGVGWVVDRVVELARKWDAPVAVDAGGPAGSFIAELEQYGVRVVKFTGGEVAHACGAFYDAVADQTISVYRGPGVDVLDRAVDCARKRQLGDKWAWARKDSTADISPLVALTLAHWCALTVPAEVNQEPFAVWG